MKKIMSIVFAAFACLLIVAFKFFPQLITFSQVIDLMLTFALVCITIYYVKSTSDIAQATKEQANASMKMARETKDARFAALKPIVMIDWTSGERGRAISPFFKNIGLGPAVNVKCYCTHTKSEFKGKHDMTTVEVGKREHISLLSEEFDFKDWAGFAINCDYQSIYGENFRTILRFKTEQERNLEISELK